MRDIEGIEKVVQKLKPHMREIETHFEAENEKFKNHLRKDYDRLGRVLKCHLIVEHYLDRFIAEHYAIDDISKIKLNFYQKALLLPEKASASAFVKPGIIALNSIRNKYAHKLEYELEKNDLGSINEILKIARENNNFSDPLDALEAFTIVACTWLILPPKNLQELFMEAFSEIRVNTQ